MRNVTAKELKIKREGFRNLYFLTKHILGYKELEERVHKPLCDFIQYTPGRLYDLEPRDTFKTTCGSVGYSIFCIINNPNIRILLSHKTTSKAKEICGEIKSHFQENEMFRRFYGDWVGSSFWGVEGFTVNRRNKVVREPTLTPGGTNKEATSAHYDLHINDDLAGLKDMYSLAERDAVLRYYKAQKYLRDKGKFIKELNIGTRWHLDDIASYAMGLKGMNIRIKQALIKSGRGYKAYFPSRYTVKELLAEQEEDPVFFASQRMNNPRPSEMQLYNADKLNYFEMDGFKPSYNIGYIDPAFGKDNKGKPCFLSFPIGSIIHDKIHIIDWPTNRYTAAKNEILIISKIKEHNLQALGIEGNVAQSEFIRNIKKELHKEGIIINIIEVTNTRNKDRRIQSMHGTVVNNVYFRNDWDKAYPEAMRQLFLYPDHKFKDAPDALEGLTQIASGKKEPNVRFI